MGKETGILLDDSLDLLVEVKRDSGGLITSGLTISVVTRQNQRTVIAAEKGEIKEAPLFGVGVASYLDDDDPSELLRDIRTNLREDGQKVKSCRFDSDGKIVIVGGYEN